jgi:hypothetical protein
LEGLILLTGGQSHQGLFAEHVAGTEKVPLRERSPGPHRNIEMDERREVIVSPVAEMSYTIKQGYSLQTPKTK